MTIDKQELKKELEQGKTFKQIADKYNYSITSRGLKQKFRSLGFEKARSIDGTDEYNGKPIYVNADELDKALKQNGYSQGVNTLEKQSVNYYTEAVDGEVRIVFTDRKWVKKDE